MKTWITGKVSRWVALVVLVPLATWALARLADRVAEREGSETTTSRLLRAPYEWRHRHDEPRRRRFGRAAS